VIRGPLRHFSVMARGWRGEKAWPMIRLTETVQDPNTAERRTERKKPCAPTAERQFKKHRRMLAGAEAALAGRLSAL